jgi:hypothetical protein
MKLALFLFAVLPCPGQKLFVYSELTRIDPFGKVVPQDRGAEPRHVLSPGIPRNATSSLRVVVWLEKPGKFNLDIAQNPDNAVRAMLYKEVFEKHGDAWLPDKLQPVTIPYNGTAADFSIPGQNYLTFWLDMTVSQTAPIDRVKVEPQLWTPEINDWVIYPMEVRIMEPVIPDRKAVSKPDAKSGFAPMPAVTEPADAALRSPLRQVLCGEKEMPAASVLTARHLVRRNAVQHLSFVRTRAEAVGLLSKTPNAPAVAAICGSGPAKAAAGPEWYLRFRDTLFRSRSREMP